MVEAFIVHKALRAWRWHWVVRQRLFLLNIFVCLLGQNSKIGKLESLFWSVLKKGLRGGREIFFPKGVDLL